MDATLLPQELKNPSVQGHQAEVWTLAVSSDGNTVVRLNRYIMCVCCLVVKVTGSHDLSMRLWECSQEPLVLSEERENVNHTHFNIIITIIQEREAEFEKAVAEGGEPVVR